MFSRWVKEIEYVGAFLVLSGFSTNAMGVLASTGSTYLLLNAIGSCLLLFAAWKHRAWGFFTLNGVWAIVAAIGLLRIAL